MIANIQALRGVAALLVVALHLGATSAEYPQLAAYRLDGNIGVDIFFVVSGFIMVHITRKSWGDWAGFLAARAWRIYPLYWIWTALTVPVAFIVIWQVATASSHEDIAFWLRSVLLIPVLSRGGGLYPALAVGWTLMYEMFFYLVVAGLMMLPRRIFIPALGVVFLATWALGQLIPDGAWHEFLSNGLYMEFWLGAMLGWIYEARRLSPSILISIVIIGWCAHTLPLGARLFYWGGPAVAMVACALFAEGAGLLLPRWLQWLGNASFSIYLAHTVLIRTLAEATTRIGADHSVLLTAAIGAATVAVAGASYIAIERPLLALRRRHPGVMNEASPGAAV